MTRLAWFLAGVAVAATVLGLAFIAYLGAGAV